MEANQQLRQFSAEGALIQQRVVAEIVDAATKGEDILFVGPTGCGKTKIFTDVLIHFAESDPEFRGLVLQGMQQLARQNQARAIEYGVPEEKTLLVMDGDVAADASSKHIVYALPQTLDNRTENIGPRRLVIIDEAHHAGDEAGSQINSVIRDLERADPNVTFIGATASPYPPQGQEFCTRLANARRITVTYQEAIDAGMITGIQTEAPNYRLKDGTYAQDVIEEKIDDRRVADTKDGLNALVARLRDDDFPQMVVRDIIRYGEQTVPTLLFADRIEDAKRLTAALEASGIRSAVIHSRMPTAQITANIKAYNAGEITHLASVDMIGEGFDAPRTRRLINTKVYMTRSEWIQTNGRAQRMGAGSDDRLYRDYGATTALHGTIKEYVRAQQFILRGGPYDAWTKLNKEPMVQGICLGKDILYAIATTDAKGRPGFSVMRSFTDPKSETRRLMHIPDPVTGAATMTRKQLEAFTRAAVSVHEADYIRLRSRTKNVTLPNGETRDIPLKNLILSRVWKAQQSAAVMMARGSPISDRQYAEIVADRRKKRSEPSLPPAHIAAAANKKRAAAAWER